MQIYSFAYKYIKHPLINGVKVPVFHRGAVIAKCREDVIVQSVVLNRPAIMIHEFADAEKAQWLMNLKNKINERRN